MHYICIISNNIKFGLVYLLGTEVFSLLVQLDSRFKFFIFPQSVFYTLVFSSFLVCIFLAIRNKL